jgi:hypothetical protein
MDWLGGTMIRRFAIVTRTGAGCSRLDRLTKNTALEAIGSPSIERRRTGPRPSETRHAPSEVMVVSSCETHKPRVA